MSFILDGRFLPLDTPFEHDGTSYPANWLRLATPEERAAIGITEVVEQPRPDDRFYWVSGPNLDGSWTTSPKDLAGLKTTWTSQINQTAWTLLNPSDWMVVRQSETQVAVPTNWLTYRADVRAKAKAVIATIAAASDVEALVAAVSGVEWPIDPDSEPKIQ